MASEDETFQKMQDVLGRQFNDDELSTFDFCDRDEPECYLDYIRSQQIIYACTADELNLLLKEGLVSNEKNKTGSKHGIDDEYLIEAIMPDSEKMRVCIAFSDDVDANNVDIGERDYSCDLYFYSMCHCNDMIGEYIDRNGHDIQTLNLLIGSCYDHPILCDNHINCARHRGFHARFPEFYSYLVELVDKFNQDDDDDWKAFVRQVKAIRTAAQMLVV